MNRTEYMQNFLNERRAYWIDMLDAPYPTSRGQVCGGRHGGWDWWIWKGADFNSERAYCGCCDRIVRGHMSPWNAAADRDWMASPYMQDLLTRMHNRSRKVAIKRSRASWTRREI
jgi:hypothetical protein